MRVCECEVPSDTQVSPAVVRAAYFRDAYSAPLTRHSLGIVDIYAAVFGHAPLYVKLLLIARNAVAKLAGLEVSSASEIMTPKIHGAYQVGDRIGPWPVFAVNEREIVAGRNNPHLDFRLSVLRTRDGALVVVSTICTVHNVAGRIYLFFITPFHRFGVKRLMSRARSANRL